jgi:hypothetical protein
MVSFSAFSMIGPFKLEEASIEPYVVIYHEVLSDAEVDHLIEIARQKRSKAMVGDFTKDGIKPESDDEARLAQVMWMYDDEYPRETGVLNARFEDMTGLSMETSEPLQIQNYGVGGHYYGHYDVMEASPDMDISRLHRAATLMLYVIRTLSDPFQFSSVQCFSCRTFKKEAQQSFHTLSYESSPSKDLRSSGTTSRTQVTTNRTRCTRAVQFYSATNGSLSKW